MVKAKDIIDRFNFKVVNNGKAEFIKISKSSINKLGLQLTGNFDFFDYESIQCIGKVEYEYINKMKKDDIEKIFTKLLENGTKIIIFCRGVKPQEQIIDISNKYNCLILFTNLITSEICTELSRFLKYELAIVITIHGVLVDVYGEGILIIGDSGIGKSETALELIKRGHRMVADDAVKIRKTGIDTLEGTAPNVTRHFMELIGIGIINIHKMFGVESVKEKQNIDLVVNLVHWDKNVEYDRLGLDIKYHEILGVNIPCNTIPVKPGRNLAMICEVAAISIRNRKMGYNSAEILSKRVTDDINNK